jgi:aspartyl-tRNA(Asn)/glutamyl-tRNA(Gln) amidotransferase subunit A
MTIRHLRGRLERGEISSRELCQDALERIADPAGEGARTFTETYAAQALAAADAADARLRAGGPALPLAGLPVSIKDLFDVAGRTTRAASVVLDGAPPARADAAIVARLRAAGAVIVGKTNMTEFAFSGLGINPHYGTPRAPYDRASGRVAGGSSSGAAVSVADGMAVAGIGTDTGGSVRIPAAFCGLVGFKPTARRVPLAGAYPLSFSLDSIGTMARSVACCAAVDAVLADAPEFDLGPLPLRALRFLAPRNYVLDGADVAIMTAFAAALDALRSAGAAVEETSLPVLDRLPELQRNGGLPGAEAYWWHRALLAGNAAAYDPQIARRIQRGAAITAEDYIALQRERRTFVAAFAAQSAGYDALLWPTVAIEPPLLAPLLADDGNYARTNLLVLRNTSAVNVADGCALSLPLPTAGAPAGLMIVGRRGEDGQLLRIGATLESVFA